MVRPLRPPAPAKQCHVAVRHGQLALGLRGGESGGGSVVKQIRTDGNAPNRCCYYVLCNYSIDVFVMNMHLLGESGGFIASPCRRSSISANRALCLSEPNVCPLSLREKTPRSTHSREHKTQSRPHTFAKFQ